MSNDLGSVNITGRRFRRTFALEIAPEYNPDTGAAEAVRLSAVRETVLVATGLKPGPITRERVEIKWADVPLAIRKAITDLDAWIDTKDTGL